jgi:hypothetical protein
MKVWFQLLQCVISAVSRTNKSSKSNEGKSMELTVNGGLTQGKKHPERTVRRPHTLDVDPARLGKPGAGEVLS